MTTKKTDTTEVTEPSVQKPSAVRLLVIGTLVVAAFFASYTFANARGGGQTAGVTGAAQGQPGTSSSPAGACCGGGSAAPAQTLEKSTTTQGGFQTLNVDTSSGSYNPNVIRAKAGVPIKITFTQSSGCLAQVQFPDFKIIEDLTGGPKTIELPALKAGEYSFMCGMNMVFGKLVVE